MRIYENDFKLEDLRQANSFSGSGSYSYSYEYGDEPLEQCEDCYTAGKNANKQYVFSRKGIAVLIICCLLISALFGVGGAHFAANSIEIPHHTFGAPPMRFAPMYLDLAEATRSNLSIQEIIEVAGDSVVDIRSDRTVSTNIFGQQVSRSLGSGVIISTDGYIMTNSHVVEDSSGMVVTLRDGSTHNAQMVGFDRRTDVAVIKINATDLTPAIFGDSDNVVIGDLAVVIGNPLGELGGTSTAGIISALNRDIEIEGRSLTVLQTDAAINQGNSGGGMFNQNAEFVGLVVAKSYGPGVEGLGFAIPINIAKPLAMNIIENGFVAGRPQIGIRMSDITSERAMIENNVTVPGIYIHSVDAPNAREAGLMPGDMLRYVEGVEINSFNDVTSTIQQHSIGDTISITVIRNNEELTFSVVLSEQRSN
jgi:serine protease Do